MLRHHPRVTQMMKVWASLFNLHRIPRCNAARCWLICRCAGFIPSMQPKDEVVITDSGRDRYDGGGGPEKYVGASDRSPMESSRTSPAAAVDGLVISALRAARMKTALMHRSETLSTSPTLAPAGVPCRDCCSTFSSPSFRAEICRVDGRVTGRRKDLDRVMSTGGTSSWTCSYETANSGIDADSLFIFLRPTKRWDFVRSIEGI